MPICDAKCLDMCIVLTHLSKQIKQTFPAHWVVRNNLNVHADALKAVNIKQIDRVRIGETAQA
jgi:hypothetical protein